MFDEMKKPIRLYMRQVDPLAPLRENIVVLDEWGDEMEHVESAHDLGDGHVVIETWETGPYDPDNPGKGSVETRENIHLYGVEVTNLWFDELLPGDEGFEDQQLSKRLKATINKVVKDMMTDIMGRSKRMLFFGSDGFPVGGVHKFSPSELAYKASDEDGDWDLDGAPCRMPVVPKVEDMPPHERYIPSSSEAHVSMPDRLREGIFAPYEADVDQVWVDGELVYKKPLTGIKMRGEPKTLEIDLGDLPPGVAVTVEFKAEDLEQGKFSIRYDETEPDAENEIVKLKIDLDASEAMAEIRDLMEDLQQQMRDVMAIPAEMLQARDEDVRSRMDAFSQRMEGRIRKSFQRNM